MKNEQYITEKFIKQKSSMDKETSRIFNLCVKNYLDVNETEDTFVDLNMPENKTLTNISITALKKGSTCIYIDNNNLLHFFSLLYNINLN